MVRATPSTFWMPSVMKVPRWLRLSDSMSAITSEGPVTVSSQNHLGLSAGDVLDVFADGFGASYFGFDQDIATYRHRVLVFLLG